MGERADGSKMEEKKRERERGHQGVVVVGMVFGMERRNEMGVESVKSRGRRGLEESQSRP